MASLGDIKRIWLLRMLGISDPQLLSETDLETILYNQTVSPATIQGTGSPEGVVTAPVGTTYNDTSVTNGAALWRKATGSGSTGWVVTSGDTGSRTIAATAVQVPGNLHLRRIGNIVEVLGLTLTAGAAPASPETIYTLPVGFRPINAMRFLYGQNGAAPNKLGATSAGALQVYGLTASQTVQFNPNWLTADAWPTSLPGT